MNKGDDLGEKIWRALIKAWADQYGQEITDLQIIRKDKQGYDNRTESTSTQIT